MAAGIFEIKRATDGQFYFILKAPNGEIIFTSELYTAKESAKIGILSVKLSMKRHAHLDQQFDQKTSLSGEPYFVLTAANGEPLGVSEMYTSPAARAKGIAAIKRHAPEAQVEDHSLADKTSEH